MIPQNKIEEIRLRLDQQSTAAILEHLGYEIFHGYKLRLRSDDRSPSTSIRKDGYIFDFGGDFGGDLISLLQDLHGMRFQEAIEYIAECLGVEL